jgi:sterol desaturase/sphingolipid hydroxylase (fatty acid hydroxylase superfamily)
VYLLASCLWTINEVVATPAMDNTTAYVGGDVVAAQVLTFLNPYVLPLHFWIGILVLKSVSVVLFDVVVFALLWASGSKKMPSRTPPIMKGLQHLGKKDVGFICFNQLIESVFIMHLFSFAENSPHVDKDLSNVSVINTLVPFYVAFVVDDFMYYWGE